MDSQFQAVSQPLRILSLDGGGIRGISSLLILEHLMEGVRKAKGLDHVPRPCNHFDFIGGTSTGGIIAIMLGRLRMTVDECLREYREVAQKAFTPKRRLNPFPGPPNGAFSARALEDAVKNTCRKFCTAEECVARRRQGLLTAETCPHSEMAFRDETCTKTAVLAITKDNVDAPPTLFTTYDESAAYHGCAIWEVARATSAATTFFKPIRVGRDGVEFVDAGFGHNNPCEVLIDEAQRQFSSRTRLQVLSIGTGLGDVVNIGNTRRKILSALTKMASTSKKVAASMDNRYGDSDQYFRLNVDKGLEDVTLSDWEQASNISAHTKNYIQENRRPIERVIDHISGRSALREVMVAAEVGEETSGHTTNGPFYYIPLPRNRLFVGRSEVLHTLKQMLFESDSQSVALHGLGGIGKTQVALQLAYSTKDEKPEYSVFWVPASSQRSFEQAYIGIATKLAVQVAENEDPKESLRRHLNSTKAGKWLLIVDNADDRDILLDSAGGSTGLYDYLPESDNGSILFTTRSLRVASYVAKTTVVDLQKMTHGEAEDLLKRSLLKSPHQDSHAIAELLKELAYLPLAITQAAAYMNENKVPVTEYLELLRNTEKDKIELLSSNFDDETRYKDSQHPVATTWLVSFEKILGDEPQAAKLLEFLAFIEPKSIPRSILPKFTSKQQLTKAIGTLCSYAFVDQREDGSKMYDMHRLVHIAARIWTERRGLLIEAKRNAVRHVAKVFPTDDYENRGLWREYLPHATRLLDENYNSMAAEACDLGFWVGRCLSVDGRTKQSIQVLEHVVAIQEKTLSEDYPDRLASHHALAWAYKSDGRVGEAILLLEHVVAIQRKTLSEDYPDRLASHHALAQAYISDGRVGEAILILEHIVAIQGKTLSENHPDQLASQHTLAQAYRSDRRVGEAILLLEHIVAIRGKTLSENHPDQLASQHTLAQAYKSDRRVGEAILLLEHIVAIQGKTLSKDHPDRLASQHNLAQAYKLDGRVGEAILLLKHIVAIQGKTLSEDHPDRLTSQNVLAELYLMT